MKKATAVALTACMIVSGAAPSMPVQAKKTSYVESLKVSKKTLKVQKGQKAVVTVKVKKKGTVSGKIKATVKNKKIASVTVRGEKLTIKGKAKGVTKITVTTVGKNKNQKRLKKAIRISVVNSTAENTTENTSQSPADTQTTTQKPQSQTTAAQSNAARSQDGSTTQNGKVTESQNRTQTTQKRTAEQNESKTTQDETGSKTTQSGEQNEGKTTQNGGQNEGKTTQDRERNEGKTTQSSEQNEGKTTQSRGQDEGKITQSSEQNEGKTTQDREQNEGKTTQNREQDENDSRTTQNGTGRKTTERDSKTSQNATDSRTTQNSAKTTGEKTTQKENKTTAIHKTTADMMTEIRTENQTKTEKQTEKTTRSDSTGEDGGITENQTGVTEDRSQTGSTEKKTTQDNSEAESTESDENQTSADKTETRTTEKQTDITTRTTTENDNTERNIIIIPTTRADIENTTEKQTTEYDAFQEHDPYTDPDQPLVGTHLPSPESAASPVLSTIHKGEATFYGGGYEGGNCLLDSMLASRKLDDVGGRIYICAINHDDYFSGLQGAFIRVTGDGGSLDVLISDQLPEGKPGDVDMAEDAFPFIDDPVKGRVNVTWQIIPWPTHLPVEFVFKEGSTKYWMGVQVRNHRYPVKKFEYLKDGEYVEVDKNPCNYYEIREPGEGPYTFRITDFIGHEIIEEVELTTPGEIVYGTQNFPY